MKILARGSKNRLQELKNKLASVNCELTCIDDTDLLTANVRNFDVIFDLKFDEKPGQLKYYASLKDKPVFVCAVKQQLAAAAFDFGYKVQCKLFGINALPTFINRQMTEVSLLHSSDLPVLESTMQQLGFSYNLVNDRVGMVSPRILFMIINEACYTLQEGTATKEDIDISMQLGTAYPMGPFKWADAIGINHIYQTLEAVYNDTKDERYKICPLLKTKYLKGESFY